MKTLHLSDKHKKFLGVCGGIAEYFEIDPTVIRLAWILVTLITGIVPGIVAYIIAAVVMPKEVS